MATISSKPNNHLICVDGTEIPIDNFCITQYNKPELIDITTFGDLPSKVFITGTDEFRVEISINDYEIKNSYTINNIVKETVGIYTSNKNGYMIISNPLFIMSTFDDCTRKYIFNFIAEKIMINNTNIAHENSSLDELCAEETNYKQQQTISSFTRFVSEIKNDKKIDKNIAKNRFQLMDL